MAKTVYYFVLSLLDSTVSNTVFVLKKLSLCHCQGVYERKPGDNQMDAAAAGAKPHSLVQVECFEQGVVV